MNGEEPEIPSQKSTLNWARNTSNIKTWRKMINTEHQNKFFEAGDWKHGLHPGTRSDINVVKEIVDNGGNITDVINHANSYQALRFGQIALSNRKPTRDWKTKIYWVWGHAGVGKTAFCFQHSIGRTWINHGNLQWFDGYNGQETVIFDDFRQDQCKLAWFFRLTDRYEQMVPIKGGFVDWCPKIILVTCVMPPNEAVMSESHDPDNIQLLRRIDKVIHLTENIIYGPEPDDDPRIKALEKSMESIEGAQISTGLSLRLIKPQSEPTPVKPNIMSVIPSISNKIITNTN